MCNVHCSTAQSNEQSQYTNSNRNELNTTDDDDDDDDDITRYELHFTLRRKRRAFIGIFCVRTVSNNDVESQTE